LQQPQQARSVPQSDKTTRNGLLVLGSSLLIVGVILFVTGQNILSSNFYEIGFGILFGIVGFIMMIDGITDFGRYL
jgi:uncharacterized membrane-anchored protein